MAFNNNSMSHEHEELVELLSRGEIDHFTFILNTEYAEDYAKWCEDHGIDPDPVSAEFYCDYIDVMMMEDSFEVMAVA